MTAHTAFDREPDRVRHQSAVGFVPLTKRLWFRVCAVALIVSWILACVFTSTLSAN